MSSFQTSLSSIRQRTEGTPWLPLLVGAAFGLLLGLLIGWVWWPVEWANASLNDLTPEARAEYLSAVADSYVVNGSEAARQQASQRLSALQGDLMAELASARDYFSAHPNQENEIRVYNLTQLTNALGGQANLAEAPVVGAPQAEALVASTPAEGAVPVVILPAGDANAVSGAVNGSIDPSASGPSWLSRFMAFLGGLLLIGGGLYVFQRLRTGNGELWPQGMRKRVIGGGESMDDYSFDDEPDFAEAGVSTVPSNRISPWTNENEPGERRSSGTSRYVPWLENPVDPEFGEDADDDMPQRPPATATADSRSVQQVRGYATEEEEAEAEFGEDEAEEGESSTAILPYRSSSSVTSTVNKQRYAEEAETDEEDDWHQEEEEDNAPAQPTQPLARHRSWGENTPPRAEPAAQPVRPGSAPSPRNPGTKTLDSFECTYYTGMGEYDESFHIADPNSKRYIGECGMGVSTKNRLLHKNPDEVIALEVWLFDKADGNSLNTQMRILMSEYASDRYAEVFHKERNGEARPFVPQPGLTFQLECPSLILKGQVLEAEYTREGIFQKVKIRMDILRR